MTRTETVKDLYLPPWCEAFDLMLWMSSSLPCKASCLNEHPIPTFERNWLEETYWKLKSHIPNQVCGILIWARGFSMEGIKWISPSSLGLKVTDPIYQWFLYATCLPNLCFSEWWLYQPCNVRIAWWLYFLFMP